MLNIPREKFEFADNGDNAKNSSSVSKHTGYFSDALARFSKNKSSVAAFIIILAIFLFSVLTPLLSYKKDKNSADTYYAKKGPMLKSMSGTGFLDGGRIRSFNERGLIHAYAIAIASSGCENSEIDLDSIDKEYRTVLTKSGKIINSKKDGRYTARVDNYAMVGFVYMQITQKEYESIKTWQNEHGIKILYPMIAENEFNPNYNDANCWYRTDTSKRNTPIDETGAPINFSKTVKLSDNYERDKDGELIYSKRVGGNSEDASLRVRVLYKSYYTYMHGAPPSFWLGTDSQGYDMSLRLASGIRTSLLIAVAVSLINFVIGAAVGAAEGYYGGAVDLITERVADILSCIPFIVVATLFQLHLSDRVGRIASLLFAFVLTGWIAVASRVRTQFYRFKNQEYVMSARTLGASDIRIIFRHIFPNAIGTVITSGVLIIPGVILNESMLSFLGIVNLGSEGTTSLGTLLSEAGSIWTNYPHLMILPAIVISLLMICFNLFGNGLRDALNPSLRGAEN